MLSGEKFFVKNRAYLSVWWTTQKGLV